MSMLKNVSCRVFSPSSVVHRSGELYQFISIPGTLQTIPLHSQIMWDNTSIMTKALFAGSQRGQPTLRWVFMLSHIPIIPQWQRQKLANVHQGASLLRAAPVKLSSRWDRVRFAPRRHVRDREEREEVGKKQRSWINRFFFFFFFFFFLKVLWACITHSSSCIFT